jgi:hypothetical protein
LASLVDHQKWPRTIMWNAQSHRIWQKARPVAFNLASDNNPGSQDLVYWVLADNPGGESCHYPDSGKWSVITKSLERAMIKGTPADYLEGEE